MPLEIRIGDLEAPEVQALLRDHLDAVREHTPMESGHALDTDGLRAHGITFWCAWKGGALVGCGALKQIDPTHGEIKSMRTAEAHLRQGVASALVEYILLEARRRGYERVSLETGSNEAFAPARALYARHGFEPCAPFAEYASDPFSYCMTLRLR